MIGSFAHTNFVLNGDKRARETAVNCREMDAIRRQWTAWLDANPWYFLKSLKDRDRLWALHGPKGAVP